MGHSDPIRVGSWDVKTGHTAVGAKQMLRDPGIETVFGEG